jgi:hypothetical protein
MNDSNLDELVSFILDQVNGALTFEPNQPSDGERNRAGDVRNNARIRLLCKDTVDH